jgi:thioredoxin-like negative regulator of GroEL
MQALTLATSLKMSEQKESASSLLAKISSRYRERKADNVRKNIQHIF